MLVIFAALAACGRSSKATPKLEEAMTDQHSGTAAPPPKAAPPTAPAVDREIAVTETSASAQVRVKVPAAWIADPVSVVLRDEFQEAIAGVQFTVICNAGCGDDELARAPRIVDQMFETRARPNVNTGDPAMDAVRLKVDTVEQGALADGAFRVARVTKPAGLQGPYREQLYAACVRVKKGAKSVAAQAWAPLDREGDLGPLIVAACKTFEIL